MTVPRTHLRPTREPPPLLPLSTETAGVNNVGKSPKKKNNNRNRWPKCDSAPSFPTRCAIVEMSSKKTKEERTVSVLLLLLLLPWLRLETDIFFYLFLRSNRRICQQPARPINSLFYHSLRDRPLHMLPPFFLLLFFSFFLFFVVFLSHFP